MLLLTTLASMLFTSYLMRFPLDKLRMPRLLAPLLVGFIFQLLPFTSSLRDVVMGEAFQLLAQLGITFLLFLIGLQLDAEKLRSLSGEIAALSILNLAFSSVLGCLILQVFGYSLLISILVSSALATVAETTIAPILDELGVIRTKMANLIVGSGILDDVAEVMVAFSASVVVGATEYTVNPAFLALGFLTLVVLALAFSRLVIPVVTRFNKEPSDTAFFLLAVSSALMFTAVSQRFGLGVLLGAILSGFTFQKLKHKDSNESDGFVSLRTITYGFLGPIFFFGIGLSVNLSSFIQAFQLTLLLLGANFLGKFSAVLLVGRKARLDHRTMIVIGLGLSTKFSMGIIPIQIFYSAKVIDQQLFSAFVAVSTITTMIIPFTLAYIINRWKQTMG